MKLTTFYRVQGLVYSILGMLLLINIQAGIVGAVIGTREVAIAASLFFGIFFLIGGLALLTISKR